ncbi:MAG: IclR family transcriptional regulator [Pseudomonas sp.]|uniref:IclR family transcriptional regulator n=1 Tax=Pseudomonas sp. TaxID=306 RepID=UPI003D6F9F18
MASKNDVPGTAAFTKFMTVLQAVSDASHPPSVGDLSKALGYPRPTTHRIVAALLAEGMLVEKGTDGRVGLGARLISLAYKAWEGSDLRAIAEPHLIHLRDALDETVHLAMRSGLEMAYISKLESRRTVRMASRIGTRVTLYSSSVGKAWLSQQSPEEVKKLIAAITLRPLTDKTITQVDELLAQIELSAARGYTTDLEENEEDICCYGSAIVVPGQGVVGCVSVSMPSYRFQALDEGKAVEAIQACTRAIATEAQTRLTTR